MAGVRFQYCSHGTTSTLTSMPGFFSVNFLNDAL